MQKQSNKYIGRYAPSPTGRLHLGNLRTGLLAWLHAHHYESVFEQFKIADLIYPCYCSRKDIQQAISAPHGKTPVYPGLCRGLSKEDRNLESECGDFVLKRVSVCCGVGRHRTKGHRCGSRV